ncbi:hypothetical protein ER308_13140 [Egibacter rhizosphaerae]|uniref:TRAP transporter substrate-binding protein n=1 Tax=Egibacter rhizosphaerae TaxID=1670831 RepID=A0A411YGR8_9ACTN|nr:TRAP transporter substrate-binding protein DctP [Egibacter rhizosphaerae]QBI20418.1 hypothetical protein ER308_13140 [Egibacter rhizosphaerae]
MHTTRTPAHPRIPRRPRAALLVVGLLALALALAACAEDEPDDAVDEPDDDVEEPEDEPDDDDDDAADDPADGDADEPDEDADDPEDEADEDGDEPEEVTLEFVTAWEDDSDEVQGFWQFAERLEEEAPWIELEYRGGPETFPNDQQGEAVRDGAVDMSVVAATYYTQNMPFAHAMKLTPFLPEEEREHGIYDLYREQHREHLNAHYLGKTKANTPFFLYSNEPIESADLSGLRVRVSPVYEPLVQELDGSAVSMAPDEVYTALERGAVDAFGWPATGVTDRGWEEVTEYELRPGFYELDVGVIVNIDVWEGLDERTREAMTDAMEETEREIPDFYEESLEEEVAEREAAGMEIIELPDDEAEAFLEAADRAGWEDAIEQAPEAEEFRELIEEIEGE